MWAHLFFLFCSSLSSVCLFVALELSAYFCCVWTGSAPVANSLISCSQVLRLPIKRHSLKHQTLIEWMSPHATAFPSFCFQSAYSCLSDLAFSLLCTWSLPCSLAWFQLFFLDKSLSSPLESWLPGPCHLVPRSALGKPGLGSDRVLNGKNLQWVSIHPTGRCLFPSPIPDPFIDFKISKLPRASLWQSLS